MKVIGGRPVGVCAWPSTVRVNGATGCTGTLIHPRVVTTAAHCLRGRQSEANVTFGERGQPGSFSVMGRCSAGADGNRGVSSGADWGYCVLPEDERIAQVPITPPLVGCEADLFLQPGAHAWIVGFGVTSPPGFFGGGGRSGKHEVEVEINQLDKQGPQTVDVGDADVGACHGDSGGPIYMELVDGDRSYGYRVFGSTSGPGEARCDCNCSTSYVNIAQHVRAIEENEGIDVTPCTAADGSWEPGPDCDAMLAKPQEATGSWPGCSVERTSTPIASCGAPLNPGPDMTLDGGAATDGSVATDASAGDAGAPVSAADADAGRPTLAPDPAGGLDPGATTGGPTAGGPDTGGLGSSTGGGLAGDVNGAVEQPVTPDASPDASLPSYSSDGGCALGGGVTSRSHLALALVLLLAMVLGCRRARHESRSGH